MTYKNSQSFVNLAPQQYWRYLGLTQDPFPTGSAGLQAPFLPERWQKIIQFLSNADQYQKVLLLVTGEQGVGKTTLCQLVYENFQHKQDSLQLQGAGLSAEKLLALLASEFNALTPSSHEDFFKTAEYQLAQLQQSGRRYLILIDEADLLPAETRELCFYLLRHQLEKQTFCLQIVLWGSPALIKPFQQLTLDHPYPGSDSPVISSLLLEPFEREEIRDYLKNCLKEAGYDGRITLFSEADIQEISQKAGGNLGQARIEAREFLQKLVSPLKKEAEVKNPLLKKIFFATLGFLVFLSLLFLLLLKFQQQNTPCDFKGNNQPIATETALSPESSTPTEAESVLPAAEPSGAESYPPGSKLVIHGEIINTSTLPKNLAPAPPAKPSVTADKQTFTLQVFISSHPQKAASFIRRYHLKEQASTYKVLRQNQILYIVTLGTYASQSEALQAIASLPKPIRRLKPWPKPLQQIQDEVTTSGGSPS